MKLLGLLSVLVLLTACGPTVSDRPCPRVTEISAAVQDQVQVELRQLGEHSAVGRVLDVVYVDREFNRSICAPTLFRFSF